MGSIASPASAIREFNPDKYPPFPPETQPCAELQTFSLAAIRAGDQNEQSRLLAVCKDQGFFYLDIVETAAQCLSEDAEAIGHLAEDVFNLPLEEKMKYPMHRKPNSLLGYKQIGSAKANQYFSRGDNAEFMNCGKDDILDTPGRFATDLPALITTPRNRSLLARFQTKAHDVGLDLLSALAVQLGLPADAFNEMHQSDRPSDTHARMIRGPPRDPTDNGEIHTPGHTDFGTITLLFNWLGGLQIWSESNHGDTFDNSVGSGPNDGKDGSQWLWIKPKPGHIIVNLGDIAVKSTGGILCAGRHRVLASPGAQGQFPRYSVVYLMRPADDHVIQRFTGGVVPPLKDDEIEESLTPAQWQARQQKQLQEGKAKATA